MPQIDDMSEAMSMRHGAQMCLNIIFLSSKVHAGPRQQSFWLLRALWCWAGVGRMAQASTTKTDGFTQSNALYMFKSPPECLVGFWSVGSLCACLAIGISVYLCHSRVQFCILMGI